MVPRSGGPRDGGGGYLGMLYILSTVVCQGEGSRSRRFFGPTDQPQAREVDVGDAHGRTDRNLIVNKTTVSRRHSSAASKDTMFSDEVPGAERDRSKYRYKNSTDYYCGRDHQQPGTATNNSVSSCKSTMGGLAHKLFRRQDLAERRKRHVSSSWHMHVKKHIANAASS